MRHIQTVSIFLTLIMTPISAHANNLDVYGLWLTPTQTAHVTLEDCGDGTPCGTIAWTEPNTDGTPRLDIHNPDTTLASRPVIGVKMLSGFTAKKSAWKKGSIYNPEDGKTYGSSLKRLDDTTLQVKGCVGPFCQTQIWTRIEK